MKTDQDLLRYDPTRTYAWNYDQRPEPVDVEIPACPGEWTFCGLTVDSPLGVPAGPLLNGAWILYYASLGFDVLTYKTARSAHRECYPPPNLQPVDAQSLAGREASVACAQEMTGSWAVSFGMPSKSPDVWRRDVEWTRQHLPKNKVLSVSVVGTVQPGWSLEQLADDYAKCARWAVESGADCIETNFSCPNVSTCDGQLFQQPADAAQVAARVRDAIGDVPYILKLGHVLEEAAATTLLDAVAPYANTLAMTNSVATTVQNADGELLFDGQPRGICGDATRAASIAQTRLFAGLIQRKGLPLTLVGVGGASTAAQVRDYLDAGAESVHIATAAMVDPTVAIRIRRGMSA